MPLTKLVMNIILSESYKIASVYVGFLYLGTVFQGLSSFCSVGYLMGKKTKGAAKTSIYGALTNLFVNLILIKYVGLFAAAFSTFVGFFIMWITRMYDVKDDFPIALNKFKFTIYLFLAISMSIVVIFTNTAVDIILILCTYFYFLLFLIIKYSLKKIRLIKLLINI